MSGVVSPAIHHSLTGGHHDLAELVRADLARVGVRIETRPADWSTFVADFTSPDRRFEAILLGYATGFRINLHDAFHSGGHDSQSGVAGYANPRVDSLIDSARRARTREEALPRYVEIQRTLRDEQPWSFLYYYPDLVLVADHLQGVEMDVRGSLLSIQKWWLAATQD